MLEIKVTLQATELSEAISRLAAAMGKENTVAVAPLPQAVPVPVQAAYTPQAVPVTQAMPVPVQPTPLQAPVYAPPPQAVPVTQAPAYTHEQIKKAGSAFMDSGKTNELVALLNAFGVQAVSQLQPEQLGAFATEMRKLGAQI